MKKIRNKFGIVMSGVCACAMHLQAGLVCEEQVLSVEQPAEKTESRGVFVLKNQGEKTVEILNVEKSCGCQDVKIEKEQLAPGEETKLDVTVQTGTSNGLLRKTLTVHSREEGGEKEDLELEMQITIPELYSISPQSVIWEMGEEPSTRKILFEVKGEEAIHIKELKTSSTLVKTNLVEIEKGRAYEIILTPDGTDLGHLGTVDIVTDCVIPHLQTAKCYYVVRRKTSP